MAIEGGEHATAETARMAVEYAKGAVLTDSDNDVLKSRSTRLVATALLTARDGDDALLAEHEAWMRHVIADAFAEEADRDTGGKLLQFHRPAMAALALIHLWARQRKSTDRDALVALAARRDRGAVLAFDKAAALIVGLEPKLLKAAMRAAYANVTWRSHDYQEGEALQRCIEEQRDATVAAAVAAEIAWLHGGTEPAWPQWPDEEPILRQGTRMRVPVSKADFDAGLADEVTPSRTSGVLHVDSRAAARWLTIIRNAPRGSVDWAPQVMAAYGDWTDRINGLGLGADVEPDREPAEWNAEFYILLAEHLLDADEPVFEAEVRRVTDLSDNTFGNVAPAVLQAADALYFNNAERDAGRPVALRTRFGARAMILRRWQYERDPGRASVDLESGEIVAKMFLNNYNPFGRTASYLPIALFDRLDPLLEPLRPLLAGGPTSFVALCTMNLLLVAPRVRHLDFLLEAVETWFEQRDASPMWLSVGIGGQVVKWFEAVLAEDGSLLASGHAARTRIDSVLSKLVGVGLAQAHELELQVEAAAVASQQIVTVTR